MGRKESHILSQYITHSILLEVNERVRELRSGHISPPKRTFPMMSHKTVAIIAFQPDAYTHMSSPERQTSVSHSILNVQP